MVKEAKEKKVEAAAVCIPKPKMKSGIVTIEGMTSLIVHQFDDKSQRMMEEKQQKKAGGKKAARDPEAEFLASLYQRKDGKSTGFPGGGIKKALIGAAYTFTDAIAKTVVRGAVMVLPAEDGDDILEVKGSLPQPRNNGMGDPVRLARKTASIAYRSEYPTPWHIDVPVRFNEDLITPEGLYNLFELAGQHVGIGDWRPACDGSHGMFQVKRG